MQGCTQGRLSLFSLLALLFAATLFTFAHAAPRAAPTSEPSDVVVEGGGDPTSNIDESMPTETAEIEPDERMPTETDIEPDDSGKANTTEITKDIIIKETKKRPLDDKEKKEIEDEVKNTAALFEDDVDKKRDLMDLHNLEERDEIDRPSSPRHCRIIARVLRGFAPWSARQFRKKNPGNGMRPHHTHMFFLYPLHRSLFDANIRPQLWFKASWVAPRFWKGPGVTFANRVYVRDKYAPFLRQSGAVSQKAFFDQTWLLAHEYQHVRQYQAHGCDEFQFGYEYIYGWCLAAGQFSDSPMEVSTSSTADKLLPLLKTETRFFRFWQRDLLRHDLGYPVETSYRNAGKDLRQLSFQKGAMQLDTKKSCYRKKTTGGWGSWDCRRL